MLLLQRLPQFVADLAKGLGKFQESQTYSHALNCSGNLGQSGQEDENGGAANHAGIFAVLRDVRH